MHDEFPMCECMFLFSASLVPMISDDRIKEKEDFITITRRQTSMSDE